MSYKEGGYYAKYEVQRTDGKPFIDQPDQFMVMCFARDEHAAKAVLDYAIHVKDENPELSEQLFNAVKKHWRIEVDPYVSRAGLQLAPIETTGSLIPITRDVSDPDPMPPAPEPQS